jgi:release factor glutamine methyltransferase
MVAHSRPNLMHRVARRVFSFVAYSVWVKPRGLRTVRTRLFGFRMTVPPTVFHPKYFFTSKFMSEFLLRQDFTNKYVLDVGSGSGILSLAAASKGGNVTSIDVNPAAVYATKANARQNGLSDRISAMEGDITAVPDLGREAFDFIVSNPPYYQRNPVNMSERAFKGGSQNEFMTSLALSLSSLLRPGGSLLLIFSSDVDAPKLLSPFQGVAFRIRPLEVKKLMFETLTIVQINRVIASSNPTHGVFNHASLHFTPMLPIFSAESDDRR